MIGIGGDRFFRRLFGKSAQPAPTQPPVMNIATVVAPTIPALEITEQTTQIWNPDKNFDHLYVRWMLSDQLGTASPYVEKTILSGLEKLRKSDLAASQLLPRFPRFCCRY